MVKVNIPKELPDCELIRHLAGKADARTDTTFDFVGTLDRFRERVSGEVRQINELFPEYTPHDEEYHLKRLFHVADTVLGKDLIEEMNSAELLVLAVGLYGHDWGMAVSDTEKEFILTGKVPEGVGRDDFCLLPDESERLLRFARDEGVEVDDQGRPRDIAVERWREYVRQTHADRSGERVRGFFEPIDGGLADAGARVCLGHWLDFEELEDFRSYPVSFPVLREQANLRALATYVRLVDLFDLAEDRTPYVVWKFVTPRDPKSRMEWAKHRALRPITCSQYQKGRAVQVYGSTNDHEVFAALEDLHLYCDKQLRACNDLLARMRDPRHYLDLLQLDWTVEARGFVPVSIQFEFDRDQMFEILSDEIYQGDPYVFLRELLQNSIDAIRMRREVLERRSGGAGNTGIIRVTVEHGQNGDATVTWQDDGVGMDEHVVRNYLAVAGKSYYRSADFEREGLEMDPISRFGIGLLSCFMVASRVEIETYRDPNMANTSDPLSITIPDLRRQFRVEKRPRESGVVGSTLRVFVRGDRLPKDDQGGLQPLDVTGYLSDTAGFVEFPILITEEGRKSLVLHPRHEAAAALDRFGHEFEVHQLSLGYPWSEALATDDLPIAQQLLREERWDLHSDLGLQGWDGALAYLVPSDDDIDQMEFGASGALVRRGMGDRQGASVRQSESWQHSRRRHPWSRGDLPAVRIFRDGVLVPKAELSERWGEGLLDMRVLVNLPISRAPRVDLARTRLLQAGEDWDAALYREYSSNLCDRSLGDLLALDPEERFYQMGRFVAFHRMRGEVLWERFPHQRWPLVLLKHGGRLAALEGGELADSSISLSPAILGEELATLANHHWLLQTAYHGLLAQWAGEDCIADLETGFHTTMPSGLSTAAFLQAHEVHTTHSVAALRFLHPPWVGNPPMAQMVCVPADRVKDAGEIEAIMERAVEHPGSVHPQERELLGAHLSDKGYKVPPIVEFLRPFEQSFGYGGDAWNLLHPVVSGLVRAACALLLSEVRPTVSDLRRGELHRALTAAIKAVPSVYLPTDEEWASLSTSLSGLWSLLRDMDLFPVYEVEEMALGLSDFVPETFHTKRMYVLMDGDEIRELSSNPILRAMDLHGGPFGQPLG